MTGSYNTFNGYYAGKVSTSGNYNVFSGAYSGYSNTTGSSNTYLGFRICVLATTASNNTVAGYKAGTLVSNGSYNTLIGSSSGYKTTTGSRNVYLGFYSGYNATGSDNVYLGYYAGYTASGDDKLYIENSTSNSPLIYGEFDNNFVTINGKLGVGTKEFGDAKLVVDGTIMAKDIIVTVDDFPDYVFEENYPLLSLAEIESFVKSHHHLPGIKPGAEIIAEGLPLGELSVLLLEKIEELTLHVIEMDKKAEGITQKSMEMQKSIDHLQAN